MKKVLKICSFCITASFAIFGICSGIEKIEASAKKLVNATKKVVPAQKK